MGKKVNVICSARMYTIGQGYAFFFTLGMRISLFYEINSIVSDIVFFCPKRSTLREMLWSFGHTKSRFYRFSSALFFGWHFLIDDGH